LSKAGQGKAGRGKGRGMGFPLWGRRARAPRPYALGLQRSPLAPTVTLAVCFPLPPGFHSPGEEKPFKLRTPAAPKVEATTACQNEEGER